MDAELAAVLVRACFERVSFAWSKMFNVSFMYIRKKG
jgi:hypothetical protein